MPLSYSEVESLFRLGRFQEICTDSAGALRDVQRLPSYEHQLLIAESLARTGRLESASHVARQVISQIGWPSQSRDDSRDHRPRPRAHGGSTTETSAIASLCQGRRRHCASRKISARDVQNYLGEAATGNRWPPLVGSASPDDALCGTSPHGSCSMSLSLVKKPK